MHCTLCQARPATLSFIMMITANTRFRLPKVEKIECQRRPYLRGLEFSNDPLERLLTQYNKPRPATPSFIMMIATNTGSRPSNQLAILQQALKERVKKCVLLQNPCSSTSYHRRQITFKDFYMMWWKGQPHSVQQNEMHSLFRFIVKSNSPPVHWNKSPYENQTF